MIRRFRLEQKGRYEKLVIAQRLSEMVDSYLDGRTAPLLIGAEQGGIGEWDDVVIYHADEHYEHFQIKRQTTPFSNKHIDKADYIKSYKPKAATKAAASAAPVVPPDSTIDSELDKAMKSLSAWSLNPQSKQPPGRAFSLILLGLEVIIKGKSNDSITANHLHEFCRLCKQDGLDLAALSSRTDTPTQNVYTWLTTWCGFTDWHHVRQTMRALTIHAVGNEENLEGRARESLARHFNDPQATLDKLVGYISTSTTDVNAISCHAMINHLKDALRSDAETWTQYLMKPPPAGPSWMVAGTHNINGTPSFSVRHAAAEIVVHHWTAGGNNRRLRLHATYCPPTPNAVALPSAILRLALHLKSGSHCLLLGEPLWRQGAGNELGRTLGISESDLDELPWIENLEALSCASSRELSTILETRDESSALHTAMNDLVWEQLQTRITARLNAVSDTPLLAALEPKWRSWAAELTADATARESLFEQLMYPKTEGLDGKHALRVGPRTADLLESAILMLLLVCVAIGNDDGNWREIPEVGDVLSIALKNWSGASGDHGGARPLADDLMAVLGPSPAPVVILAGVEGSPTSLLESGMADDFETSNSMAAERQPRLLVTRFGVLRYLRTGTLAELQGQFKRHWDAWRDAREGAIQAHGEGH
ncbi:ABC-three component system protein [Burkholderia seminalis]|uniref:ABC-three component system protein n=1 Tax=Burkholderia seminalis TaxID=488731 RepID=UPI001CF563CF|nr:ABC-three component system protein [Burkholderia seminalis]